MYNLFYKLRKSPFSLNPDPDFLYLSPKHKNALAVLERSLANWVGLSAITGEKGTGKSTLIRYLLKQSWPDVTFGLVSESDPPSVGLLKRTLSAFGLNPFGKTTSESYDLLSDFMVIDCFWKKRQPVLIIDESLGMESRALEELYMLSTIEPEKNRKLRIILVMPPSLWETLKRPTWSHLARRVGNSYQLETLNYQETVAYVQHRLRVAGAQNESLFDDPACKAIFRYSGGNPRLINVLCNAALVQGAIQETPQIGAALIKDLIMQKLWLREANTAPRGRVQGRAQTEGKIVDQAAGIKSDTDSLRPALGRLAKRDKTGQTVSEFIIADIDHASRKYARPDAKVSNASDKREPTGEASRRGDRRLLQVASVAAVILITAAVAIFFYWDRYSRESPSVQRDQDAQGLITAFRPSQEAQQNIDLPDPIQAVNESVSVVRKLLAQQESRDDADFLVGDEGVPEDATDETASSIAIEPASEQRGPVGGQDEGSVPQESKDNTTQFVVKGEAPVTASGSEAPSISIELAPEQSEPIRGQDKASAPQESRDNTTQSVAEDETRATASGSEAPSIPIAPAPEQSEPVRGQDKASAPQESKDNTTQFVAKGEAPVTASGSEAPSISIEPALEQSEPVRGQDKASAPQESRDNTTQLVAEDETRATAAGAEASSVPVAPASKQSESGSGQDKRSLPNESEDNTTQLVAEDETRATAPDLEAPSTPIEPASKQSESDSGQDQGSLQNESEDLAAGLIAKDEKHANATDLKASSVPVNPDPNRSQSGGTGSDEPYVTELLARAEQQIAAKHLVTPAGDAALETYQSILALVPGHSGASRGIKRIKELYLAWALAARQRGQLAKAQSYAERAATVDPQDNDLAQLLDQIKAERKLKIEVAALKEFEVEKANAAVSPMEEAKVLGKPDIEAVKKTTPQSGVPAQEPDTAPSDLQAQRVSEVDNLLIKAQQQFDMQHLTQPVDDNAWETFQEVQQLDPANQLAREGLQRIAQRIESMAQDKQQSGDLLTSMAIIEEGLRVMPDHSGLLALKEEINRQLEAQRAAQQVEEQPAPSDDKEATPEPKKKKRRRVKSFGTFF